MAKFKADFTNVGDGFTLVPEGDYICKVAKITVEQGDKGKYLKWELVIGLGEYKGQKLFHNTSLLPQALFNLRNTILALGVNVPKSAFTVDTESYIGKILGCTVTHREYKKDGQNKKAADLAELWVAKRTDKGWTRAGSAPVTKAEAKAELENVEDMEGAVNGVSDDDIEEIEV